MKIFSPILKGTTTVAQGTTNLSGSFTGSLLGTAATASYADNFTVGGTLTAQTINVQIITSSIEFNTGSTRNGSTTANTHQFTGSVLMSGSLNVTGSAVFSSDVVLPYSKALAFNSISNQYITADASGLYLGTANLSRLVINTSGSVGIGTISPSASLETRVAVESPATNRIALIAATSNGANDIFRWYDGTTQLGVFKNSGNVGIGTSSPVALDSGGVNLQIKDRSALFQLAAVNSTYLSNNIYYDGSWKRIVSGYGAMIRINDDNNGFSFLTTGTGASNSAVTFTSAMSITNAGNVGIGLADPLGKLSTLGGAVQIMGDYVNHQTIIKSAGATGTFNGELTITIPQMSNASIDGYGSYSCEVYVAAYPGHYCHAWFSGYNNGGITPLEATVLRSSGGFSISQTSTGANNQGFIFVINYPNTFVHPTARIIFNKGGSITSTAHPANSITAVFS